MKSRPSVYRSDILGDRGRDRDEIRVWLMGLGRVREPGGARAMRDGQGLIRPVLETPADD